MIDLHVHSKHSADAEGELGAICAKAAQMSVTTLAITDHYDFFSTCAELDFTFDVDAMHKDLMRTQEAVGNRVRLLFGVEAGQPHADPAFTESVLGKHDFDLIIGSLHSFPREDDFYYLQFQQIHAGNFLKQYLDEIEKMIDYGAFDILAHIDYPLRYVREDGFVPTLVPYLDRLTPIFQKMMAKGIALEINARGLTTSLGVVGPELPVLQHYRALGGERISFGSDSHHPDTVGKGLAECHDLAKRAGFQKAVTYVRRNAMFYSI